MQTQPAEHGLKEIFSVSRLNSAARFLLEKHFASVWVEGEISNFAAPHSGHWYFSLKDEAAQVRCAMFKGNQRQLGFVPKDGMHVLIKARVSLYENRGEYQLIAEDMEERGQGKLQRAFEALKAKLQAAGLFDPAHKKPLPIYPTQIGVITSATGAAIRDILQVLKRRYPCTPVIIYPSLVQGQQAAPNLVKALQLANERNECDILILARGGGSLEDLWPFNEESVAHAIFASRIPIISGVGHEIDFTIADFVADMRAPTPSAAAEIITPHKNELLTALFRSKQQIMGQMRNRLARAKQQLSWLETHLQQQHPKRQLTEKMQRLDFYEASLVQLQHRALHREQTKIKDLAFQLQRHVPSLKINASQNQVKLYQQHINHLILKLINKARTDLANCAAKLHMLSPLATLQRGYAIATTQGRVLHDAQQVKLGEAVQVRLANGLLECIVKEIM